MYIDDRSIQMPGITGKEQNNARRAWVVFTGKTEIFWLRLLRPGFRHCWIILHDGRHWTSIDPLSNRMEFETHYHLPADYDLPGWHGARGGLTIVEAPVLPSLNRAAPMGVMSCVEVIKRILGIHAFQVWTPWALYCHLIRNGGIEWKPKSS